LTEEELAEAKECLKPGTIDGFSSSEILIKKSLLKALSAKKQTLRTETFSTYLCHHEHSS